MVGQAREGGGRRRSRDVAHPLAHDRWRCRRRRRARRRPALARASGSRIRGDAGTGRGRGRACPHRDRRRARFPRRRSCTLIDSRGGGRHRFAHEPNAPQEVVIAAKRLRAAKRLDHALSRAARKRDRQPQQDSVVASALLGTGFKQRAHDQRCAGNDFDAAEFPADFDPLVDGLVRGALGELVEPLLSET